MLIIGTSVHVFVCVATRVANNRVQILIQNKFKLDYLCKDWCNLRMQYLYALPKPLLGRLCIKPYQLKVFNDFIIYVQKRSVSIWNLNVLTSRWILVLKRHSIQNKIHIMRRGSNRNTVGFRPLSLKILWIQEERG